jgi:AAA15 family ATPase/GTPase
MKKMKIEFCDGNGEQVTVAVSGQFSKERLLQILGLFDNNQYQHTSLPITQTSMDKIIDLIKTKLNNSWFTSRDISLIYTEQHREHIKSSTISTYLTRLYNNGYIERKGNRSCWQYKLIINFAADNDVKTFINNLNKK